MKVHQTFFFDVWTNKNKDAKQGDQIVFLPLSQPAKNETFQQPVVPRTHHHPHYSLTFITIKPQNIEDIENIVASTVALPQLYI